MTFTPSTVRVLATKALKDHNRCQRIANRQTEESKRVFWAHQSAIYMRLRLFYESWNYIG